MYKLSFYVPATHLDVVKNALFAQGAGRIGNYSHCAWQTKGTGQYCPQEGANPFKGKQQEIMYAIEYKVEMVCKDELLPQLLTTLVAMHPYEEPAYEAYKITTLDLADVNQA